MLRPIIKVNGEYYTGETHFTGGKVVIRHSPSAFDAKRFYLEVSAEQKARQIGGRVVWLNPLNGDVVEENDGSEDA